MGTEYTKKLKDFIRQNLKKNQENGARHRYIPPGMKNANRDVEGVHTNRE